MELEPTVAFVSRDSPLEICVNFGLFAGRELERADVDELAGALLRIVGGVSLFAGRRYELASGAVEVTAYEVRIEFPTFTLPRGSAERQSVVDELVETITLWSRSCALNPPEGGEDLTSRLARGTPAGATEDVMEPDRQL
jgi:hypothetical protein